MSKTGTLTIGALARAAGVGIETIRFYERKGLLPEPPRTQAGYRQYAPDTVRRLRFIRRAQGLGFSLGEISELLDLRIAELSACGTVEGRARDKLAQIGEKISELKRIESALERLVVRCKAGETTSECPILEELAKS
ncbi:MAG: MerR family transcriptional regulator [Gemmatimonadetes bacterium]|nr:MerR family transcriptional regulator [Gemmatimonadota bacterium]